MIGLVNIAERSLFLTVYTKIDKNNEDFNNVYEWFINANYLDLGDPKFEDALNKKIFLRIVEDKNIEVNYYHL